MAFEDTYRLSVHAVITDEQNRVLQLRANYDGGRWGLPGGSLEPGETVHQALLRECKEELGCAVRVDAMTGMYYHQAYNSHACIFRCYLPAGSQIRLSSEHSAFHFFGLDELGPVQQQRVKDCLEFDGQLRSAAF